MLYNGRPYPAIVPSHGRLGPSSNIWFLGPTRAQNPNGTSMSPAVFAHMAAECPYTLQWFARFPLNIARSHVVIWTPCNTWLFGPTRVLNHCSPQSSKPISHLVTLFLYFYPQSTLNFI